MRVHVTVLVALCAFAATAPSSAIDFPQLPGDVLDQLPDVDIGAAAEQAAIAAHDAAVNLHDELAQNAPGVVQDALDSAEQAAIAAHEAAVNLHDELAQNAPNIGQDVLDSVEQAAIAAHDAAVTLHDEAAQYVSGRRSVAASASRKELFVSAVTSSCPSSCDPSWLGDHTCQSECNVEACNYDNGDCCPSSCHSSWLGNHVCDGACMSPQCYYDYGDCFYEFKSRYILVRKLFLSWKDADEFCWEFFGTELASVRTWAELNWVYSAWHQLIAYRNLWIGLYELHRWGPKNRNGWAWSDGSHYAQQKFWRSSQPDKSYEKCGLFWSVKKAKAWDNAPCSWRAEFLCNA